MNINASMISDLELRRKDECFKKFLLSFKMIKEDKVFYTISHSRFHRSCYFMEYLAAGFLHLLLPWGNELIESWLSIDWLGSIFGWIVKALIHFIFLCN